MIKVLFVCLGNICRSPLAEAIFNDLIKKEGLNSMINCDSAGTSNYHIGSCPDFRTIKNAKRNKISIDHFARQFLVSDFGKYDYILAMDKSNKNNIMKLSKNVDGYEKKVFLMRDFEKGDFMGKDVPDPYFGGEDGFQYVHDILKRTCSVFLSFLKEKHQLNNEK